MDFDNANITIIDTETNTRVLQDELAEVKSIHLIYNGTEDRLNRIMSSELRFNFLVTDGSDAKYQHLMTSNEKRYKVTVEIVDDSDVFLYNLWQGYLLPEQFSEPYKTGIYFVNFIATDGLGLLKGKPLAPFHTGGIYVNNLISQCLSAAVFLPLIHIAPAIENAVSAMQIDDYLVELSAYYDSDKLLFDDIYSILDRILLMLGCKVFQYNAEWYLVGINRFEDQNILFENYNSYGTYVDTTLYNRSLLPVYFLNDTANITILNSFKNVSVLWGRNMSSNILPLDLVYQPIENGNTWSDSNFNIKYWDESFADAGLSAPFVLGTKEGDAASWDDGIWVNNPGYITINLTVLPAVIDDNYVSLIKPVFIDANQKLSLKISGVTLFTYDVSALDFSGCIFYEVYLDSNVIISNKPSFTNYAKYDFELSYNDTLMSFKLDIDEITIDHAGVIDVRFYAFNNHTVNADPLKIIYHEFILSSDQESTITETLIRDNENTQNYNVDAFHGSSLTDLTNRSIRISTTVPFTGYTVNYPEILQQVTIQSYQQYDVTNSGITITHYRAEFIYDDWLYLKDHYDYIFLKKGGIGTLVKPTYYQLLDEIPTSSYPYLDPIPPVKAFIFDQTILSVLPYRIESGDEIWVYKAASSVTYTDRHYLMLDWKLYGGTQKEPLNKILARLYHNYVESYRYVVNGSVLGCYGPLDYIEFKYVTDKKFIPTVLNIDLVNSQTEITMIEPTNSEVTNYE